MLEETEGYFATGSDDKLIKIWNLNKSISVRTLQDHTAGIICLEV